MGEYYVSLGRLGKVSDVGYQLRFTLLGGGFLQLQKAIKKGSVAKFAALSGSAFRLLRHVGKVSVVGRKTPSAMFARPELVPEGQELCRWSAAELGSSCFFSCFYGIREEEENR